VPWVPREFRPAISAGPRPAFAAGLIVALALAQPASAFAQQPVIRSFLTGDPVPATILGGGLARAAARANVDEATRTVSDTLDVNAPAAPLHAEVPPAASDRAGIRLGEPPAAIGNDSDILPFAHHEVPESFPSIGLAIGFGAYLSGFASIEQAFHTMEDAYRAGGFSVPSAADVELPPMVLATIRLRLSRRFDLSAQVGRATGVSDELRLLGGLASAHYWLSPTGKASLWAGLGGGTCGFSSTRNYSAQITPVDGNGGYYVLDTITLEGGATYWTAAGGLAIRMWPHGALEGQVQYLGTGDASTGATRAGDVRVNMSGTLIAVSITANL
jgi:hypothetical protein